MCVCALMEIFTALCDMRGCCSAAKHTAGRTVQLGISHRASKSVDQRVGAKYNKAPGFPPSTQPQERRQGGGEEAEDKQKKKQKKKWMNRKKRRRRTRKTKTSDLACATEDLFNFNRA